METAETIQETPEEEKRRRRALLYWYFIPVGMLLVALGVVLTVGGGEGESADAVTTSEVEDGSFAFADETDDDPTFEGLDEVGHDPFMAPWERAALFEEDLPEDHPAGLYGGTLENTCDPDRLIEFLEANPDKAQAWANTQGITVAEIPSYVSSLTPTILESDTTVTNHSFSNGVAVPIVAVLEAGTAVLVDDEGTPRARCYCGNPLLGVEEVPPPPTTPTTLAPPMGVLCWAEGSLFEHIGDAEAPLVAQTAVGGEAVKILERGANNDGGASYRVELVGSGTTGWIGVNAVTCTQSCASTNQIVSLDSPANDFSTSVPAGVVVHLTGLTQTTSSGSTEAAAYWQVGGTNVHGWIPTSGLTTTGCPVGECLAMNAPLYVGFGESSNDVINDPADFNTPRPWTAQTTGQTLTSNGVTFVQLTNGFDQGWIFTQGGGGFTEVWTEAPYLQGQQCREEVVCYSNFAFGDVHVDPVLQSSVESFPMTTARLTGQTQFEPPFTIWFQIEFVDWELEREWRYGWVRAPFVPNGECGRTNVCLSGFGSTAVSFELPEVFGGQNHANTPPITATRTGYQQYDQSGTTLYTQVDLVDPTSNTTFTDRWLPAAGLLVGPCEDEPDQLLTQCSAAQLHDGSQTYMVINVAPNDPDGGLVIRDQPGLSQNRLGALDFDETGITVTSCAVGPQGVVWWELGGQFGWVSASFLAPETSQAISCAAGPFDPQGKNVLGSATGQFDTGTAGNDTLYLYTQGNSTWVQFELADGSVSSAANLGAVSSSFAPINVLGGFAPNQIAHLTDIAGAGGAVGGISMLVHLNGCDAERIEDPAGVPFQIREEGGLQNYSSLHCENGSPNTFVAIAGRNNGNGPNDWSFQADGWTYNGSTMLVTAGQGQGTGALPGQPC